MKERTSGQKRTARGQVLDVLTAGMVGCKLSYLGNCTLMVTISKKKFCRRRRLLRCSTIPHHRYLYLYLYLSSSISCLLPPPPFFFFFSSLLPSFVSPTISSTLHHIVQHLWVFLDFCVLSPTANIHHTNFFHVLPPTALMSRLLVMLANHWPTTNDHLLITFILPRRPSHKHTSSNV